VKTPKGVRADFRIETPTSTVAVRGTENTVRTIEGFGTAVGGHSGVTDVINRMGQRTTVRREENAQVLPQTNKIESNLQLARLAGDSPIIDYGRTQEETRAIIDINSNIQLPEKEIREVINTLPQTSTLELHWDFEGISKTYTTPQ
jgi:SAM-dependent MidA family methyltransferase